MVTHEAATVALDVLRVLDGTRSLANGKTAAETEPRRTLEGEAIRVLRGYLAEYKSEPLEAPAT